MAKAQSKTKAKATPKKAAAKAPAKAVKSAAPKAPAKAAKSVAPTPSKPPAKATSKAPPVKTSSRTSQTPKATGRTESSSVKPKAKIEFGSTEEKKKVSANTEINADGIRAHADAGLSKAEVAQLYKALVEEKARKEGELGQRVNDALAEDDILADEIDIAQRSTDQAWVFRFADKERKLLIEIDAALEKMRNGEYGICEGTDEPIGFKRLEARPWTRYSVAHKELLEREKQQQAR